MNSCELMIQQLCITDSQLVRISWPTSLTHNYSYFFFFWGVGGEKALFILIKQLCITTFMAIQIFKKKKKNCKTHSKGRGLLIYFFS